MPLFQTLKMTVPAGINDLLESFSDASVGLPAVTVIVAPESVCCRLLPGSANSADANPATPQKVSPASRRTERDLTTGKPPCSRQR